MLEKPKKIEKSQTNEFYEEMIEKNYDNPSEILKNYKSA